jgi:hypothetical protein
MKEQWAKKQPVVNTSDLEARDKRIAELIAKAQKIGLRFFLFIM